MIVTPLVRALAVGALMTSLAACDSAEERAEKHYQSALSLLEDGKVPQAIVELRNVFTLDENNVAALRTYAEASRQVGNTSEAFGAYQRIAEIEPENLDIRLVLTEMAILAQNWDLAERHGSVLLAADARREGSEIADLALQFRQAAVDEDTERFRELTEVAARLAEEDPANPILIRMLVEGYTRDGEFERALTAVDPAIEAYPNDRAYWMIRAQILAELQDIERLEEHLRAAVEQFPDDEEQKAALLRLLIQTGQSERAEAYLRDGIDSAARPVDQHVTLIALLRRTEGDEAALAEIDAALERHEETQIFRALRAGIRFDMGERDAAISELQEIIDSSEPSDQTDRYKVTLARMLITTENDVGARKLVEEVLESDPTQTEALKMSAEWLIEADQVDEAIAALRTALDVAPEDAEAMTLMARAHTRNGNPELAQDLLSLAVEASGNAPAESIRYASLLFDEERYRSAEDVLIASLRRAPGDERLLRLLGEVYVASEDWPRATQVEETLRREGTETALQIANDLRLRILSGRDGRESALSYLESLADEDGGDAAAQIGLIRARISDGRSEEAIELAQTLVEENPENPNAKLVLASTYVALREFSEAERIYRDLLAEDATRDNVWVQLIRAISADGRRDEAAAAVEEALAANPGSPNLLWAKASFLERANDIDGAIAIYEELYAENPNSAVVANNLASLISTYRSGEQAIERAWTVARRLKGTDIAPFQDTYGWITFLRGNPEEALTYLEPAAEGLPSDPIVQFHLGKVYEALGRIDDAISAYDRAVKIAGENDSREQIVEARAQIEVLSEKRPSE